MNKVSKRYKSRMSVLLRQANAAQLYLADFISLRTSLQELRYSQRLIKKHGETLDWEAISISRFLIVVPITTLTGISVGLKLSLFSLRALEEAEEKYGPCPAHIRSQILSFMSKRKEN